MPLLTPDNRRRRNGAGFTLIEMTVMIGVVLLLAALVLPSVTAIEQSREVRRLKADLQRLPREAEDAARRLNATVALRVDGDALVMERIPNGADSEGEDAEELKRIPLRQYFQVERARQGRENLDVASWQWKIYPDGSRNSGNLEFHAGDNTQSLMLPAEGEAYWINGPEPELDEDHWPAGELQVRGS